MNFQRLWPSGFVPVEKRRRAEGRVCRMRIISPSVTILDQIDGEQMIKNIEAWGRVCYKSEDRISQDSAAAFVRNILKSGHESVIEHEKVTVRIVCDRGVSHEIVRHRIASYSQESTRYCNYSKDKFGNALTFIRPCFWEEGDAKYLLWEEQMRSIEQAYFRLLEAGASPQEARSVLPNSLKTEMIVTMNLREWRHFFALRTHPRAHPQMREVAGLLLAEFQRRIPVLFEDFPLSP